MNFNALCPQLPPLPQQQQQQQQQQLQKVQLPNLQQQQQQLLRPSIWSRMETLRMVWTTGKIEVSDRWLLKTESTIFRFACHCLYWSPDCQLTGCQISVSSSSTFSGEQALLVEGRSAKWAGPDAGHFHIFCICNWSGNIAQMPCLNSNPRSQLGWPGRHWEGEVDLGDDDGGRGSLWLHLDSEEDTHGRQHQVLPG